MWFGRCYRANDVIVDTFTARLDDTLRLLDAFVPPIGASSWLVPAAHVTLRIRPAASPGEKPMPIFCVSDLHLCDRGYRDNFAVEGREARFHKFLDYVEAEGGQLYILGDLFDWWQANLSRSIRAYRDLLARLAHIGPAGGLWVAGNHDNALTDFIGSEIKLRGLELPAMSKAFEATIGGRRFAFLHGHESDPYCRDLNPGTGEITAIISGLLEDRNRGPFDRESPCRGRPVRRHAGRGLDPLAEADVSARPPG